MIKRLDSYIFREMMVPLLIGILSFVLMFQANMLIALFKELNLNSVPPAAIGQFVLLKTPSFLQMTLPIGVALASSLAIARLARESELTAIRVAGVPVRRVLVPVFLLGIVISIANFFVTERLMPVTELRSRNLMSEIGVLAGVPPVKQDVMLKLKEYTARFGRVWPNPDNSISIDQVLLIESPRPGEYVITTSEKGEYRNGIWKFEDVTQLQVKGTAVTGFASKGKPVTIGERISIPEFFSSAAIEERSLEQLRDDIALARQQKRDPTQLLVSYYNKFSVPVSCLVFSLTGPAMALAFARRGPFVGVLMSLLMVLAWYNLFVISNQILGRNGWVAPQVAAWAPNAVILLVGLWVLRRTE